MESNSIFAQPQSTNQSLCFHKRPKLCFLSYSVESGDISGVTSWLLRFIPYLIFNGYDVAVLLHRFGSVISSSDVAASFREYGAIVLEIERPRYMEDAVTSVLQFLEQHRPQLFLPQCLPEGFLAANIAGIQGLAWVATLHSDDPDYWAIMGAVSPANNMGTVVAVSEHIARLASGYCKLSVPLSIPYGVSTSGASATWSDETFTVVFCGRVVERQKRISLVIRAMLAACQRDSRIRCKIIGDGEDRATSESAVREAGLEDRISFIGRLPPERIDRELAKAQSLLLLSDFEGLPVCVLEAMARGVVPIARDIPSGIPEIISNLETGILVTDDPEDAAEAICRLASSESLWRTCSEGAYKLFLEKFREEDCFRRWAELISRRLVTNDVATDGRYPIRFTLPPPLSLVAVTDLRHPPILNRAASYLKASFKRILKKIVTIRNFLKSRCLQYATCKKNRSNDSVDN